MFKVTFPNLNYKFDEEYNGTQYGTQNGTQSIESKNEMDRIIEMIKVNNKITRKDMSKILNIPIRTLQRKLNQQKNIIYIGTGKSGHWEIVE